MGGRVERVGVERRKGGGAARRMCKGEREGKANLPLPGCPRLVRGNSAAIGTPRLAWPPILARGGWGMIRGCSPRRDPLLGVGIP